MTRATITIKEKNGLYNNLWYINNDGYIELGLGEEILKLLKTVDDIKNAPQIFKEHGIDLWTFENDFGLVCKRTSFIKPILDRFNDYSYVFDEKTGKWGYYKFNHPTLHELNIPRLIVSENDDKYDLEEEDLGDLELPSKTRLDYNQSAQLLIISAKHKNTETSIILNYRDIHSLMDYITKILK